MTQVCLVCGHTKLYVVETHLGLARGFAELSAFPAELEVVFRKRKCRACGNISRHAEVCLDALIEEEVNHGKERQEAEEDY